MATGELISDRSWHSSPSLNYSVTYETQRPNKYSKTVKVRFTVVIRSLYSSCSFGYPIYFSNTIDGNSRTITSNFGSGVKSVSYTSDWIEFSSTGTSLTVGITPKCGDGGHTSYDEGKIYFDSYQEPLANITSFSVENISGNDGLTKVKFNWSVDAECDYAWYSKDNGSSWSSLPSNNIVSGLAPNTTYKFKLRVRRKDSQKTTDSGAVSKTTYDIAKLSSASNFNLGSNTNIVITNPAGATATLAIKVGTTQILSKSVSAGTNTIKFTDAQLDAIYKKFTTSNSVTVSYVLTTNSNTNWTSSKNVTCTLTGNQKTGRVNIGGSWKRAKGWININGSYKRCVAWENINGSWKRCI